MSIDGHGPRGILPWCRFAVVLVDMYALVAFVLVDMYAQLAIVLVDIYAFSALSLWTCTHRSIIFEVSSCRDHFLRVSLPIR